MKKIIEQYRLECWLGAEKPSFFGFIQWTFLGIKWFLKLTVGGKICQLKGHKYCNDGGYATPDSGGDYFTCTRCGHSFTHIYY